MKSKHPFFTFFLTAFLTVLTISSYAQIYSTIAGGPWNDEDTWVGGIIPGPTDDVVIAGTVRCSSTLACNNITIGSTGTLQNDYYSGDLTAFGNVINYGTINNYSSTFSFLIMGDVTNDGTWVNSYTRIIGVIGQTVTCLNGNVFGGYEFTVEKTNGAFFFDGINNFENCRVLMYDLDIYLQPNSTLNLHDGLFNNCTLYGSGTTSIVNGIGAYNSDAPEFTSVDFNNLTITGELNVNNNCSTHGTVINNGTLRNSYYSQTLNLYDDFINNGGIYNYSGTLTLDIYGNFTNNNVVDNHAMDFRGSGLQQVTLTAGMTFSPTYWSNFKPDGDIESLTDLTFDNVNVDMNGGNLILPDGGFMNMLDGRFGEAVLYSNDMSKAYGDVNYHCESGAATDNLTTHNATLTGQFECGANVYFRGTTTNNGILENNYYSETVEIYDDFINNGTINNYSGNLTMKIFGNFTNNAIVDNNAMDFYGDDVQYISLLEGEEYSPHYFTSFKPSGAIIALTDLNFYITHINMDDDDLILQDDGSLFLTGGYLNNATLYDTDPLNGYLHLELLSDAYISNCVITSPELLGMADIGSNNTFIDDILITDTMRNDYYGYTLTIDGNIINNGVIQNYSSAFTININGDVTNNGTWNNSYTYLNGTTDQNLTCLNSNFFSGIQFFSTNSAANINLNNEVNFQNTQVRFEGNNAELPINSTLQLHGGYLTDCNLHGNGETSIVHGEGEFYVDGPYMQNSTLEDVRFTGDWGIGVGITLNGTIINDGRIQNNYYAYTIEVNANFTNNGIIRSYSSDLTMNMYDDFTNNGSWAGHAIDLHGEYDQHITLADGEIFNPTYFTSFKPSGNIIGLTDLTFVTTYITLENDPLIVPENSTLSISGRYLLRGDVMATNGRFFLDMTGDAYIQDCSLTDVTLLGITDVNSDNEFYGTTINYGNLRNDYYTKTAEFYGDLINNGTISNYSGSFIVNAHADIVNNGNWINYYTQMVGTEDQTVTLKNGTSIDGQMRFVSDILATPYSWYWDNWLIENPPYPEPAIISGESSSTLTWISPVNSNWLGTYRCLAGGVWSRNIIIEECTSGEEVAPLSLDFGTHQISSGTESLSTYISNTGDCNNYYENIYLSGLEAPFSTATDHYQNVEILSGQSLEIPVIMDKDYIPGIYYDQLFLSSYNMDEVDLSNGLAAYYPFNGNANDISGNGRDGTIQGNPTLVEDRFGNPNSAYNFDGALDYITAGSWFTFEDFSISVWVQQEGYTGDYMDIIDNNHSSTTNWVIQANGNNSNYGFHVLQVGAVYGNIPLNEWKHVVCTKSGTTISFYIDGVLSEQVISGNATMNYNNPMLNIARWGGGSRHFDGTLDDIRLYDRGLNHGEIIELYYENTTNPEIATIDVTVELIAEYDVQINAFFEGPFNGMDMNTDINSILPLDQPYNVYPWDYMGGESVPSIPNTDIVDWLLVEFRDAPDAESALPGTSLGGQAAFILKDGSIVDIDGSSLLTMDHAISNNLFVVLWHRNHLPVLSANPVTKVGQLYSYDFTDALTKAYGDNQSDLGGGYFGLIGGDANADGIINEFDGTEVWIPEAGITGYLQGDVNMDTQVDNKDKNDIWWSNIGQEEILPIELPTEGLVAYYPFNGNANDESGNANHGTVYGATLTYDRFGNVNCAYNFDGAGNYIKAAADNLPIADRTISFWFNANTVSNDPVPFAYGGSSCGTSWFQLIVGNGNNYHRSSHCNVNALNCPFTQDPVNDWYHWVITNSPDGSKMYINGILLCSDDNYVTNTVVGGKDMAIGVCVDPSGYAPFTNPDVDYFNGALDDFLIYDRELSESEIQDLYDIQSFTKSIYGDLLKDEMDVK